MLCHYLGYTDLMDLAYCRGDTVAKQMEARLFGVHTRATIPLTENRSAGFNDVCEEAILGDGRGVKIYNVS